MSAVGSLAAVPTVSGHSLRALKRASSKASKPVVRSGAWNAWFPTQNALSSRETYRAITQRPPCAAATPRLRMIFQDPSRFCAASRPSSGSRPFC